MKRRAPFIAIVAVAYLLILGCNGDSEPGNGGLAATVPGTTAIPSPEASPVSTPRPSSALPPKSGVSIFDTRTGFRADIPVTDPYAYIDLQGTPWVVVVEKGTRRYYDLQGEEIPPPVINAHVFECSVVDGSAVILGRTYLGVPTCGIVSMDISATWMLFQVPGADVPIGGGRTASTWDQWVLNRHTDEHRLLQTGLRHCGGCDGRFGPGWSPDGRFVYFAETYDKGRIFLSDMETNKTRLISEGETITSAQPQWAGSSSLIYRGPGDTVIFEDLGAGSKRALSALQWPACFVADRYVYSAAGGQQVQVYSIAEQRIVATLIGTLDTNGNGYPISCPNPPPIAITEAGDDDEVVSVVSGGSSCAGIAVYRVADQVACVDLPLLVNETKENLRDDARSALSMQGDQVAIARLTDLAPPRPCTVSPCNQATIEALSQSGRSTGVDPFRRLHTYEVLVVDTKTGVQKTLATGLQSTSPPQLTWDSSSTYLLVRWPFETFSGP